MPTKDDCLTADGSLGEKEFRTKILYKSRADLIEKLRAVADSMEAGSDILYCKPSWLRVVRFNCCGGGGP